MTDVPLEIDVATVKQKLDAGDDLLIIDVREPDEHAIARIAAAKLVPMGEISDRLSELEEHKARPVVVHCHHGGRSRRVTNWLRQQGFTHAQNMTGGIDAWSQAVDSSVPRY
jgi:rhodanese-related sulfurtransferase